MCFRTFPVLQFSKFPTTCCKYQIWHWFTRLYKLYYHTLIIKCLENILSNFVFLFQKNADIRQIERKNINNLVNNVTPEESAKPTTSSSSKQPTAPSTATKSNTTTPKNGGEETGGKNLASLWKSTAQNVITVKK